MAGGAEGGVVVKAVEGFSAAVVVAVVVVVVTAAAAVAVGFRHDLSSPPLLTLPSPCPGPPCLILVSPGQGGEGGVVLASPNHLRASHWAAPGGQPSPSNNTPTTSRIPKTQFTQEEEEEEEEGKEAVRLDSFPADDHRRGSRE
ncbi:hypothetical protein E2C01_072583 [Portunus trituberculatus]|uniref:Uncharacterized protein n=1 Tax=Portunus trituberculatus TaxID=210409 RepID=A0A5B7I7K6_PORTR|nr:hypothetical protein [Portunus trituberculatus]